MKTLSSCTVTRSDERAISAAETLSNENWNRSSKTQLVQPFSTRVAAVAGVSPRSILICTRGSDVPSQLSERSSRTWMMWTLITNVPDGMWLSIALVSSPSSSRARAIALSGA